MKRAAGLTERVAARVRRMYVDLRTQYESLLAGEPVLYTPPRRYDGQPAVVIEDDLVVEKGVKSVWMKLAEFLLARGYAPDMYLRLVLDPHRLRLGRTPEPGQLMTPDCVRYFEKLHARLGESLQVALNTQRAVATASIQGLESTGMSRDEAVAVVLCDKGMGLSPLFRYCLARSMPLPRFQRLARRFLPGALAQFAMYRQQYARVWRAFLPVGFVRMATRRRQRPGGV
jgi:hypothetical protein